MKNQIKKILEKKDKSQGWLADKLQKDKSYISKLINGAIDPKISTAFQVARALGRGVDEVFIYENGEFGNGNIDD